MNTQPTSYIAAHEADERRQHRVWGLGVLFVMLHLGYFACPFLPGVGTQTWWPWLALPPPLFACGYAVMVVRLLRRWHRARATDHAFIAIPAQEEARS
jgi:hypothetical protein